MSVGSRIKELRESKEMSRNELANMLNVTVGAISNYENGVSSPKEPILFKIIEILECDANYLFQDSIKMSSITNDVSIAEYEIIKKFRTLDEHGKELVTTILDKEYTRVSNIDYVIKADGKEDIIIEKNRSYTDNIQRFSTYSDCLAAAHERTDTEVTEEMKKHDDDIMDDDNF